MPVKVVPIIHPLPPLVNQILSDLYGEFKFVNTPYFPLAALSEVQIGVGSETMCKWYRETDDRPLRAALAFNACEDTVIFADVYMRVDEPLLPVRIKLRCIANIDRLDCDRSKAVALVSSEAEWRDLVETVVRPLVAYAIEKDNALGFH
jgi:hypothetical protein